MKVKHGKRFLSLLLAVTLVATALPSTANASQVSAASSTSTVETAPETPPSDSEAQQGTTVNDQESSSGDESKKDQSDAANAPEGGNVDQGGETDSASKSDDQQSGEQGEEDSEDQKQGDTVEDKDGQQDSTSEKQPDGEEVIDETSGEETPANEILPEEIEEETEDDEEASLYKNKDVEITDLPNMPYWNYYYGDPDYSENFYVQNEDGKILPEMYVDDLEEILDMVDEGMDLSNFFRGTIFDGFTEETLNRMLDEGYSLLYATHLLLNYMDMPDWLAEAFGNGSAGGVNFQAADDSGSGPSSLTASGVSQMSLEPLGVISSLGGSQSHGVVYRLRARGDDGNLYSAFCARYGGSYRSGYTYSEASYGSIGLSNYQYNLIRTVVNTYYKATGQQDRDFTAAQIIIWYIINNMKSSSDYFDPDEAWTNGGMREAATKISGPLYAEFIRRTILSYSNYINQWWDAGHSDNSIESVHFNPDYYPGVFANLHFWVCGNSTAQYIITWDIESGATTFDRVEIPYVDNYYIEKKATAKYNVEITKESLITNELLENIEFHVVESEAGGHDQDYDIYKGTLSEYGEDYPDATITTFGQTTTENDHVPYMDDDVKPSGGQHETYLTTDENGYASTTFVHKHTFREFYSDCKDGSNMLIDYATYEQIWEQALRTAEEAEATDLGNPIEVLYKGATLEMTYDEIKAIHDTQTTVYTQPHEVAQDTIDTMYSEYMARTYTYTVTELDNYTRPAATDSNGKTLDEIALPKEGYRKDVTDTTTIGSYVEEVENGGTMVTGGTNDQDENSQEKNVTNEPWQNQFFINKTDLESNNQIFYDTAFEIYEYYQYKVTQEAAERTIRVDDLLLRYEQEQNNGNQLDYDTIESAVLKITGENGAEVYNQTLDLDAIKEIQNDVPYTVTYTPTAAEKYTVTLELTLKQALSTNNLRTETFTGSLKDVTSESGNTGFSKTYALYKDVRKSLRVTESGENSWNVEGGGTVTLTNSVSTGSNGTSQIEGPLIYSYTDKDGKTRTLSSADDKAGIDVSVNVTNGNASYTFSYSEKIDTGYRFYTNDNGATYTVKTPAGNPATYEVDEDVYTISAHTGSYPEDATYTVETSFEVAEKDLISRELDTEVGTDLNDYTTWGQDNYEIVRVTPEIAQQMGWSDTTIGMYTVHRLHDTDAYSGTTFSASTDHATGEKFGYYEYGSLYYTQANLGHFTIVEKTAPADGDKSGYLGNYSDRDDSKLTEDSAKKNPDGAPYATDDNLSVVKMVHPIQLCKDTNQYATYMLVDGYKEYDAEKYTNYVENLDNEEQTPTEDGYDAAGWYEQSGMRPSISLEKYTLDEQNAENQKRDVLNAWVDNYLTQYIREKSGIETITRNSQKQDTYFALKLAMAYQLNFVGTTINNDSFNNALSAESRITYNGTYTKTKLNYNSYAAEQAEALNARHGFNDNDFLQVGVPTYDNADAEKQNRYYQTEADVNKEQGYSFLDERTYGYIRFTKYDSDAERYVDGDIDAGYDLGTDHGDADLNGAIYSLYVSEDNTFTVHYYEGTYNGTLVWAQVMKDGGYRMIEDKDGDAANGFTDAGDNTYTDYPHAYIRDGKLFLDYTDDASASFAVTAKEATYKGIQHPDGCYGGAKHNGWFAVLTEQQVFVDADQDGFGDTWTLQDVTLENGAKVASATITDGEFEMDGLYLGNYYLAEELRTVVAIFSTDNNDRETSEVRWLSFAPGYLAATDDNGNPIHYNYSFPYEGQMRDGETYEAEQVYLQKDTEKNSNQQVIKGAGFQINKKMTKNESGSSGNTEQKALEGAGFTVYLISELSLIKDGTITPAYSVKDGNQLVYDNSLVALYDEAGNFVGYKFTDQYIDANRPFEAKYGDDYDIRTANRLVYVKDRGYYYVDDILAGYKNAYYSDLNKKWNFSGETNAIARMYEDNENTVTEINRDYAYQDNKLNQGSPCEWYGPNGISDGWVATGVRNEYRLSEIYTNHYGNLRSPELPWGAYMVVETTTPSDVFTVDPMFVTVSDSSASANRSKSVTLTDASFVASLVMVKKDADSGQDVIQSGIKYRIWDYQKQRYARQYLYGPDGSLSIIAQDVFVTSEKGRLDAVASLEKGKYRIEEVDGPKGFYNLYWDQGNEREDEEHGGLGEDASRPARDNLFKSYYGTVDFEVTTDRHYKSSGIVSNGNLDYIYIGETYNNKEAVGKVNILKTGEVLVGYANTDDIEYADEYTDRSDAQYNALKASAKDRAVFKKIKAHYDLGTDEVEYRDVTEDVTVAHIQKVDYLATDRNGMHLAAIYEGDNGLKYTMNGGIVYQTGAYQTVNGEKMFYPLVSSIDTVDGKFVYTDADGKEIIYTEAVDSTTGATVYTDEDGNVLDELTQADIIAALEPYCSITDMNGNVVYGKESSFVLFDESANILMMVYDLKIDTYEDASLTPVPNMSIYHVQGKKVSTDYLVTDENGVLTTEDGGILTAKSGDTYTITWTEGIYDPDTNYDYQVTFSDGSTLDVKYVTYGLYISNDGILIRRMAGGGYEKTAADGTVTEDSGASLALVGDDTGETWDFVYEERPLAGATYEITAAEDIYSQDGNGGCWFKKGDVVATVTTGNDGEIVSFAPVYKTGSSAGSGSYNYTYYYPEEDGRTESLTDKKYYSGEQYATSGGIENYWIASRMSELDTALFGTPAYTDATVYPNTYYNEQTTPIIRRVTRGTGSAAGKTTNYVTRLEEEGGLSTHSAGVVTETDDGYRITYTSVNDYMGARLEDQTGGYYLLKLADGNTIEVKPSENVFHVLSSVSGQWTEEDYVTRTAAGYEVTHTDDYEAGVSQGATTAGAKDLGYTHKSVYANAAIEKQEDGTYKLFDNTGAEILTMESDVLMTEAGAYVEKITGGYRITTVKSEDYTGNAYVTAALTIDGATLTVKNETFKLIWDDLNNEFVTTSKNVVTLADDGSSVNVDVDGKAVTYQAFDLVINYRLHYATQSQIVKVENDGTLGEVSVYLPLGKYNIQEIATPYGFVINDQVQTVDLEYADQTKGVVFNCNEATSDWTDKTMKIWDSKGLTWFLGGVNTIGETLKDIFGTNFWTWGTYFHAEKPFYGDKEGFVSFYDQRVKAWSREDVPESDNKKVVISKQSLTGLTELPGAKLEIRNATGEVVEEWTSTNTPHIVVGLADGTYTLTETTAPDGYEKAENITFMVKDGTTDGTITMYDAPEKKEIYISKKDITSGNELPGAKLVLTNENGEVMKSWISGRNPEKIENLPDGKYTLTEITAPNGYDKAESITFEVVESVVKGGTITMYDAPDEQKVYISKQDITTSKELPGATLILTNESGKVVDRWTSSNVAHEIEELADGKYTLTETTAPTGYERAESITFTVIDGKAVGGIVTMYDKPRDDQGGPEGDRREESEENQWKLGVGIYKADKDTNASLGGAKFGLYTKNDIYNVDGKLIAKAGTKLAVATTDDTGHANFAVDIALMSKYLDAERKDTLLIHKKTVTYTYTSLTPGPDADTWYLEAPGTDTILLTKEGSDYVTGDGRHLTIDTTKKTVTYTVEQSIDGNTAINSGAYYIQEITPPKGYLIDDTIYDVHFEYDNDTTMYIPVYAKHANVPTEVSLTKEDITGVAEIPGNQISFYKIKDVLDVDEDGIISHDDDNLILIDQWVSGDGAHTIKGLELSNDEWPRLNNQEIRKNIYVFRETSPAAGYVSAPDIEVMVYQICDENGSWFDADGNLYGYKVLTAHMEADQDYKEGNLMIPNTHADDWSAAGKAESDWDYSATLNGIKAADWLLIHKNLIITVAAETTQRTLNKVLKESDFADLDFDVVYFDFSGDKLDVSGFFQKKQVADRPADSHITYTKTWVSMEDIAIHMYDDTTKVQINKYDITTGEEVAGAHLVVKDAETGAVIEEWVTGDDGYNTDGKPLPHYIEEKLKANHPYILEETFAPTEDGYVKSNSVEFQLSDSGEVQKVSMMDDYTKVQISKADMTTGEEIDGAHLTIWKLDADGNRVEKVADWVTGEDGYDADGKPIKHQIDRLPVGNYVLVEESAPTGYMVAEDVTFTVAEDGKLQKVQMLDAPTSLKIYKYKTGTTEFVEGAVIDVYEIPQEYVQYLTPETRFEAFGTMVDPSKDAGFEEASEEKGAADLGAYLTGMKASGTEHRNGYTSYLTFNYSMLKADLVNAGYTLTQKLPESIALDAALNQSYDAYDGSTKAFTYRIGKSGNANTITVTFDKAYAAVHDVLNFSVSADADLADSVLTANGSLRIKVTDTYTLKIAKDEVKEIDSNVTAPAKTIKLTDADRRATVTTNGGPMTITGLMPGWYVAMEREAPKGFILDTTPQVFHLLSASGEQALYFYNAPKKPHHSGGGHGSSEPTPEVPVVPNEPLIGKLTLTINGGFMWNNVRTEDNGDDGSSILFEIEHSNNAALPIIWVVRGLVAAAAVIGIAGIVLVIRRRREEE